jgi:hypothetical protein
MFRTCLDEIFRRLFIGIILCLSHYSIAQDVVKIVINPNKVQIGECKLNDLVESIEYIPLETNDECLVGQIEIFDISEKYIVINCVKSESIYLFHRSGRFICKVGSRGNGPGEYLSLGGLFIDEKRSRILVIDGYKRKQINYNLKGKFISDKSIEEKTSIGLYMRMYKDNFFINKLERRDNPFVHEIRDLNLQLITENIKKDHYQKGSVINVVGIPSFYLYNDKNHIRGLELNDTLYSIEKDFSFKPKYIVNAGRYEITADMLARSDDAFFLQCVCFQQFFETKDKLLISYHFGSVRSSIDYCYHDNNTRKVLHFKSDKGIPNDYDGGLDFWPERQDNLEWYAFYDAHLFKDKFKEKKTLKGDVNAIQSFEKFKQKLDSDDNPVLVIVKIKE